MMHCVLNKPRAAATAGERAARASTAFFDQMMLAGSANGSSSVTGGSPSTFRGAIAAWPSSAFRLLLAIVCKSLNEFATDYREGLQFHR